MHFTRRTFLLATAALLAQACAGIPLSGGNRRRARYFIPSPGIYIGKKQDFSRLRFDRVLRSDRFPNHSSLVTVVSQDGREVRRILVPGNIHATVVSPEYTYLISVDRPSVLHVVDTESFEILATKTEEDDRGFTFGGHLVELPDGKHFAITMNGSEMGKYSYISIREKTTLREVERYSSYGFEAHDIALSSDGKSVFVAHYGSYIGSGPYKELSGVSFGQVMYKKGKSYLKSPKFPLIYPSATSRVDIATGTLLDRHAYPLNGPQGHLALGAGDAIYTSSRPTLVRKRPDSLSHPAFREGISRPEWVSDFLPKAASFGTTVVYDPVARQVLVASRYEDKLLYVDEDKPDEFREIDLRQYAPDFNFAHAVGLLPDGKHYVVTANNWVLGFERKTHRHVPALSFPLENFVHSHCSVL